MCYFLVDKWLFSCSQTSIFHRWFNFFPTYCLKFDCFYWYFILLPELGCFFAGANTVIQYSKDTELQYFWAEKLRALHLNLWKPLSPCRGQIGSVDNLNIFNFVLSDTEEMCQQWGPTASKHKSLTSNNLDSTSPLVLSHWRSATFISFRSKSVDQKWLLTPTKQKTPALRMFSWVRPHIVKSYACVRIGQYRQ